MSFHSKSEMRRVAIQDPTTLMYEMSKLMDENDRLRKALESVIFVFEEVDKQSALGGGGYIDMEVVAKARAVLNGETK